MQGQQFIKFNGIVSELPSSHATTYSYLLDASMEARLGATAHESPGYSAPKNQNFSRSYKHLKRYGHILSQTIPIRTTLIQSP
jgi:hypothetical protein